MGRKRILKQLHIGVVLCLVGLFCGCGVDFPSVSDEQITQVGEYAAITLLRYEAASRSRLLSEEEIREAEEKRAAWEAMANGKEEESEEAPEKEPEHSWDGQADDSTVSEVQYDKLEDFFILPEGVKLQYTGYQICGSYMEDESSFFSLEASAGKELLVIRFQLTNSGQQDQEIDFLKENSAYWVTLNQTYTRSPLTTLLMSDLSTFKGMIKGGSAQEAVLLVEIDEGMDISSMTLKCKNDLIRCTILLK